MYMNFMLNKYRKIPTQRPPPSKRPPPFSAPKVLQRGHISSCNRPERLFLGTCRLTLYEKCSVMVTFLFHQLSCQMSKKCRSLTILTQSSSRSLLSIGTTRMELTCQKRRVNLKSTERESESGLRITTLSV